MACLADEIPNQLSLGKVCHGSSSDKPEQYKKKVSASRRFPPQCGTNAEPIPPEALQDMIVSIDDNVALHAHADSLQSGINVLAWSNVLKEKKSKEKSSQAMHKTDWRDKCRVVAKKSTCVLTSPIKKQTILLSAATSRVLAARDKEPTATSRFATPCVGGASSSHSCDKEPTATSRFATPCVGGAGSSHACDKELQEDLPTLCGGASSSHARDKVRDTLCSFRTICNQLLNKPKSRKLEKGKIKDGRIDFEAMKILKQKGVQFNTKKYIGSVPGVEVGDEFRYRVELTIVGIHRPNRAGIDYIRLKGKVIATSIVASGAYDDGWDNTGVLIYSGQGGNLVGSNKEPEDQKMEKGNLALKNSIITKNEVRVIRGSKSAGLVYDGLYIVEKYRKETGAHGKKVYKFELRRIPDQPLVWKSRNSSTW